MAERSRNKRIKIAFVISYFKNNGPSNVIRDIIDNLERSSYEISLITLFTGNDPEIIERLKKEQVNVYECHTLTRTKCLLGQDKEFKHIVANGNFDIIHTHGFIPDILSSRIKTSAKKVTTIHNNMFEDYVNTYGKIKASLLIHIHLNALRKFGTCVCCSKSIFTVMKKHLSNVTFIRNGIRSQMPKHIVKREDMDIPCDAIVFIYSGCLSIGKNIRLLIQNFVEYHNDNEYLLILGTGPEQEICERLIDDHVRLLGFQNDPIAYYYISNIYTSASLSEGFSVSVLEALSCGLGLFLSDIPSHKEVIFEAKELYLGETFPINKGGESFLKALNTLRNNYNYISKEDIRNFQKEDLSDEAMTSIYQKVYETILRDERINDIDANELN